MKEPKDFDELADMSINQLLLEIVMDNMNGIEMSDESKFYTQQLIFDKYEVLQQEREFVFNKISLNRYKSKDGKRIDFDTARVGNLKAKLDSVLSKKVVSEHWLNTIGKTDSDLEQRIRAYRLGNIDHSKRDKVLSANLSDYSVDLTLHIKRDKGGHIILAGEKIRKSLERIAEKPGRRIVREKAKRVAAEKEKNSHYKPKEGIGEYNLQDGLIQDLTGLHYVFTPDKGGIDALYSFRDYLVRSDSIAVFEIEQKPRPENTIHLSVKPLAREIEIPLITEVDTIEIQLMDLSAYLTKEIGNLSQFHYASLQSLLRDPRLTQAQLNCITDEDRKFVKSSKEAILDVLQYQPPKK